MLTNTNFEMKELGGIVDFQESPIIQELVSSLENSDAGKKQKLFKGLADRINSLGKIDFSLMQDAFTKVQRSVQLTETMNEFDDFLALTGQPQPFTNNSILSNNKSRLSNQNESDIFEIQQDFELFERSNSPLDLGISGNSSVVELIAELLARLRETKLEGMTNECVRKYLATLSEVTS